MSPSIPRGTPIVTRLLVGYFFKKPITYGYLSLTLSVQFQALQVPYLTASLDVAGYNYILKAALCLGNRLPIHCL